MNFLITGGTGFIGTALCSHLSKQGHSIVVKSRQPESIDASIKGITALSQLDLDEKFDVVINLAGEPIANKRWSDKQRQKILASRIDTTQEVIDYFRRSNNKPGLFISGSAIGYYGVSTTNEAMSEESSGDDSFSSELCAQWEECALQAESEGIRTCLLRTGIVLGEGGGALAKMLPPFKFGLGGRIGSGEQWMPWIHLDDLIGIIDYCIEQESFDGPINCTAPNPVTNASFTEALGGALKRPTVLPMPAVVVKLLMGKMGEELLLAGKKVLPVKIQTAGFQFKYERLETALENIL